MEKAKFYDWQIRAFNHIKDQNAVLSAPTGSGKTLVAYLWSGILKRNGEINHEINADRVIFTAPIKALSNERYLDLRRMGLDVGIETGDFKRNEGAKIICCTQEIYTVKYAHVPNQKLIIDEFHYIFNDSDRARSYIDGIKNTSPDTQLLVMSATLGNIKAIGKYLSEICMREFVVHAAKKRVTELIYTPDKPVERFDVHDSLVFVFTQRGVIELAELLASTRKRIDPRNISRLEKLARILEVKRVFSSLYKGIGIYHGSMLPKEKLLVEEAFRERLIDTVCGTSALSLGVNLPAQSVVFAQLVNFYNYQPISKNEFLQMSGRAGRKGLCDPGYVTWLKDSPFESHFQKTETTFKKLMDSKIEDAVITLRPSFGKLLRKQTLIEFEAEYIAEYSLPALNPDNVLESLERSMSRINQAAGKLARGKNKGRFKKIMAEIWYDEMEIDD